MRKLGKCSRNLALAAMAVALMVAATGIALAADTEGPIKVGEPEPLAIGTTHPYAAAAGDNALQWVVRYPGATYIRIHFSRFDLAPGDYLEVSNADGTYTRILEGKGPHGNGSFWGYTIFGDTAILRLQAIVGGGFGFEADQFGRGITPIWEPEPSPPATPESVCGSQDWKDVECYKDSYPTEYEKARGAVKAQIGCCSACTGFKVSDSGQFMTNNHCTSSQSGVQSTELFFEYQKPACNSGTASDTGSVFGQDLLKTDYTLDYTLFTTTGDSSSIPCLEIDARLAPVGERIYIAGHPSAGPKKLSIESDMDGGLCQVDDSPHPGNDSTSDIGYYCDTTNGSSGSPVLSGDTNKVVAIHHFGGCLNSGVRMDRIYKQISGLLDSCAGGPPPTCGDGTCDAGEDTCSCPEDCGSPPATETSCTNGVDDDCDGLTDCDDSDCNSDPACQAPTCLPKGSSCSVDADCCSSKCRGSKKHGLLCR